MRRVVGLTSDELATRERVFDGLTMKAVRRSLRALTVNVVDTFTAAATPQLSTTPSEPNPTIPAGALGVVTTTWTQEVDEVLFPYLVQTFVDAAEDVYAAMPETTGVAPKITYDLAASYLRSASNRLRGIGDLVWADMREQLALGYEAGESINQLAARLRTVAKISEPRALTIARTEVVSAANFGSLAQLKAVGFTDEECRKEWLATEDGRTRPAHLEADGQLVGLSQPFVVGGDFLQVPGDPAGRAENVINCRCSVAYVFDEDGDEDGDEPLVADAAFEAKHPRQPDGRFGTKSPFTILPEAERGRSGNKLYAPGMLGQYGGAGLMMRHVGADGVPRYMVVQRGPNNFKSKWLWQLPGGSRDENETAAQAAARETFEEIGFTQEQLDTLEPRGAHVVKLPVEGKDPWTYSSVVADAPAAFKPKIDYTELGAARWLTYDQLVEMRGRGRLIAPFAAQLEDIIAKFDAPAVAGFLVTDVTTSQDHVGYYALMTASKSHWTAADEAKVKRDAEGKFAKKAGAKITQHVPLHINTAVIYKKGGHKPNEVIAEKAGTTATDGVAQRLIWHATAKKFLLQAQADNGVDWISVESYSKKAAYDKFSKETGWTKPAKAESVVAIAPPTAKAAPSLKDVAAQQVADKTAATPIVVKEMTEVTPKLGKPIHINTTAVYKTKYADGAIVAERELGDDLGTAQQLRWDAKSKKFVLLENVGNGWKTVALYNKGETYQKFSKQTGWTHPVKKPPTPDKKTTASKFAATTKVSEMSPGEVTYLLSALTSDELAAKYGQADLDALNEKLLDALDFGLMTEQEAEVLSDKITIALGQKASAINLPDLDSMTPVKALASILGMTPGDWQKLSPLQKAIVNDKFEELDASGTVSENQYKKYEKLTGQTLPAVGPAKPASGASLDQIMKALTTSELLDWLGTGISIAELGQYSQDELENLKAKIGKLLIAGDIDYDTAIAAGDKIDQAMVPSIVEIPDFDDDAPSKVAMFYDNLTQDDFDGLSASDQAQVAQNASFYDSIAPPGVSYSDKIDSFVAGKGDSSADKVPNFAVESAILMMTQSEYDALSKDEKIKLYDDFKKLPDPTGALEKTMTQLIKTHIEKQQAATGTPTASPKVSFDWDDNSGPHGMTPIYYEGQLIGHAESSPDGSVAQLYDLNPVSPSSSYGQFVGVVNFDDGESIPNAVIDLVDSGMLSVPSAGVGPGYVPNVVDDGVDKLTPHGKSPKVTFDWDDSSGPNGTTPILYNGVVIAWAKSTPNGDGALIYDNPDYAPIGSFVGTVDFDAGESISNVIIDMLNENKLSMTIAALELDVEDFLMKNSDTQANLMKNMTDSEIDALSPSEYAEIAAQAALLYKYDHLTKVEFDAFNAKGTKTAVPNVTKAPASAPTSVAAPAPVAGSKFFVDVHGKIKNANEISTPASPAPPPSMYKTKTPSGAAAMQQTMLSAAGKTWNGVQVAAIKKYGTSVGYRSINAVLRDDPKQLKLFNDSQLADAVKHAVNLQNAMTPLTDDVKLFRGTGAHAFGQNSISANFDELKKLQGSVVTDKGFLSTTVDENKGVSYDYAKKPIQVVFSVPAGTPALHVDSAIPGHSEHEVLLAAGTSYRIDEVRKATDADRVKYGNPNLEHVVEATIVPTPAGSSTPLSAPPAKPASYVAPTTLTPGTPNAPVSATKAGPIKASDLKWPMKINTATVYKVKYEHGAVVAYRKNPDGSLSRLAWNGTTKKFILQNQQSDGSWETFAGYGKGETYQSFGKLDTSGKWFSPPPGDSAIGSGGPFGTTSVAPKVSTTVPAPSTVTTAPAPAPAKQEKFDAAELQKLHGQIPAGMWPGKERELFDDFKKNSSSGFVTLSSPEASLFTALHETLVKNNDLAKVSSLIKPLNMLQLLKIIDEESTNKANAIAKSKGEAGNLVNEHLYEKKLIAWLQTPSGATYATEILHPPPPVPYDPSGPVNANKTYKSPNFTPQIINTLHKIKDPAQIGTPDPKANVFAPISHSKALELQKIQLASDPWTTTQKNALAKYTGSYYTTMNPIVRDIVKETQYQSETTLLTAARTAVNIQAGMRPLPESIKVFRKTNPDQFSAFGLNHSSKFADIKKLEGKLFIDQAPMSTSIDPNKWSGSVHFEIDLPKGTPAVYVDNISSHQGEMEMILALGLKYRIISVKEQHGITKVHMRVEA